MVNIPHHSGMPVLLTVFNLLIRPPDLISSPNSYYYRVTFSLLCYFQIRLGRCLRHVGASLSEEWEGAGGQARVLVLRVSQVHVQQHVHVLFSLGVKRHE